MKNIKKIITLVLLSTVTWSTSQAQTFGDVLNTIFGENNTTNRNSTNKSDKGLGAGLSNTEISNGLKEALKLGTNNASKRLSIQDGFFKNAAVKILLPPEARQVETVLRQAGMGHLADKAILYMNRAAEDAASKAAPIFVNAITSMTLTDAVGILRGGDHAATNYLQAKTQQQLMTAFSPVVRNSLNKVGAQKAWEEAFNAYNKIPFVKKVNPDLTAYVTQKATEGMFISIAEEELKIRKNPMGQASNLLKRVFGGK